MFVDSSRVWIMHESTPLGRCRSMKEDHICHDATRNLRTNERRIVVNGKLSLRRFKMLCLEDHHIPLLLNDDFKKFLECVMIFLKNFVVVPEIRIYYPKISAIFFSSGISLPQQGEPFFTSSGKVFWQWELITGSGNALSILFPTILL
nr:hypothetical protein [Tanacetum cinerariifolium]